MGYLWELLHCYHDVLDFEPRVQFTTEQVKHSETDPFCTMNSWQDPSGEAGLLLKQQGVTITHVFTSVLQRAARALDSLTMSYRCGGFHNLGIPPLMEAPMW